MKEQVEPRLNLCTRRTRKAVFADEMALVMPRRELIAVKATVAAVARAGR